MSFTEDFFVFYDTETTGLDINFDEYLRIFRTTLLGGGGSFPNTNEILYYVLFQIV